MPPKLTLLPPHQSGNPEALMRVLLTVALRMAQKNVVGSKQAA